MRVLKSPGLLTVRVSGAVCLAPASPSSQTAPHLMSLEQWGSSGKIAIGCVSTGSYHRRFDSALQLCKDLLLFIVEHGWRPTCKYGGWCSSRQIILCEARWLAALVLGRAAARNAFETTIRNGNMELDVVVRSSSHTRQVEDCTGVVNHTERGIGRTCCIE
jgi:hypothetical protein